MKKNPKILTTNYNKKNNSSKKFSLPYRLIIKLLFLLIIVSGLIYFFLYSSFFKISNVIIDGSELIEGEEVEQAVFFYIEDNKNIWSFDSQGLENEIKKSFSLAQRVKVQKGVPDTIRVKIEERSPALIWLSGNEKYLIDDFGFVFSNLADYQEKKELLTSKLVAVKDRNNLPVSVNQRLVSKNWVEFINEIDVSLIDQFNLPAKRYYITETAFDLYVITSKGNLIFDVNRPAEDQLAALKTALDSIDRKKFNYLDLRINGWVYYK